MILIWSIFSLFVHYSCHFESVFLTFCSVFHPYITNHCHFYCSSQSDPTSYPLSVQYNNKVIIPIVLCSLFLTHFIVSLSSLGLSLYFFTFYSFIQTCRWNIWQKITVNSIFWQVRSILVIIQTHYPNIYKCHIAWNNPMHPIQPTIAVYWNSMIMSILTPPYISLIIEQYCLLLTTAI